MYASFTCHSLAKSDLLESEKYGLHQQLGVLPIAALFHNINTQIQDNIYSHPLSPPWPEQCN